MSDACTDPRCVRLNGRCVGMHWTPPMGSGITSQGHRECQPPSPHPVELDGRVSQRCAQGCADGGHCYTDDVHVARHCWYGYDETYEGTWD